MAPLDLTAASQELFARIHRAALVLTGNPWDADDLAQETFLVVARHGHQFEGRSNLYTWLYGILLNLDRRHRRRWSLNRRKLHVLWSQDSQQQAAAPAADVPLEVAEWKKSLWSYVARLPEGQRQALVLRYSEHLTYDEISQALGCPLGTVKSRIFNGLAALRALLADENDLAREAPAHPLKDFQHAV